MDNEHVDKPKRMYLGEEYSKLSDIIVECTKSLIKTCEMINDPPKIAEVVKRIYEAETEGDVIRDRLLKSFSTEKHPPMLQLDRISLLNRLDKIANKTEHAGRQVELAGLFYPKKYVPDLMKICEKVLESVELVANATKVLFESFSEAFELVKDVENIRDNTRDLTFELQTKALQDQESTYQTLFAIDKISSRVQQVAERAKQAADLIEIMKMKYI